MDAEYAIVGGGIVGASIAYHLAERTDGPIVVFEQAESLATETTAKSNAMFRLTGSSPEREMKRYGLTQYNEFLADPIVDHEVDPLYERIDRVEVATSSRTAAQLRERAQTGVGEYVDPAELPAHILFPELRTDDIDGALWFADSIRMEPRALALEFAARARANGARFNTGTLVRDITRTADGVTGIETDAGPVTAATVISAAGPNNVDIAEMAGIQLPSRHTLGPILDVKPHEALRHTVPNLKHVDSGVYYTGRANGTVMIGRAGGGYDNAVRRDVDTLTDDRVPDAIRAEMAETSNRLIPRLALEDVEVRDEWVGLVSKTPDGEPIIGRTEVDGFAVAAFHSEAIQLAPAAGCIMAEQLVDGRPATEYPHVSPSRFSTHADYAIQ